MALTWCSTIVGRSCILCVVHPVLLYYRKTWSSHAGDVRHLDLSDTRWPLSVVRTEWSDSVNNVAIKNGLLGFGPQDTPARRIQLSRLPWLNYVSRIVEMSTIPCSNIHFSYWVQESTWRSTDNVATECENVQRIQVKYVSCAFGSKIPVSQLDGDAAEGNDSESWTVGIMLFSVGSEWPKNISVFRVSVTGALSPFSISPILLQLAFSSSLLQLGALRGKSRWAELTLPLSAE